MGILFLIDSTLLFVPSRVTLRGSSCDQRACSTVFRNGRPKPAAESGGTKKVAVDIAGLSEQFVFEMVMLQIADRIRLLLLKVLESKSPDFS